MSETIDHVWSNGTERDLWLSGNCERCTQSTSIDTIPNPCPLQSALYDYLGTGEMPLDLAIRAGLMDEGRPAGYHPCPEFERGEAKGASNE